jgi:hypothetical protein
MRLLDSSDEGELPLARLVRNGRRDSRLRLSARQKILNSDRTTTNSQREAVR